jgi:hypothetical protein
MKVIYYQGGGLQNGVCLELNEKALAIPVPATSLQTSLVSTSDRAVFSILVLTFPGSSASISRRNCSHWVRRDPQGRR